MAMVIEGRLSVSTIRADVNRIGASLQASMANAIATEGFLLTVHG